VSTSGTFGLPRPLMYGPSFPSIRMVMREGAQVFESRTNQNLFLDGEDFTADGTFTMARLLRTLPPCQGCGDPHNEVESTCPMVVQDSDWADGKPTSWTMHGRPQYSACPGMDLLFGYCNSGAQKRFLMAYCMALFARGLESVMRLAKIDQVIERAEGSYTSLEFLRATERFALDELLAFPALIPEAWLNAIGADRTEEDVAHLSENPQRVDFVLFPEWKRCVIEIDGPSHYATYDEEARRYDVSEELYTKNLRIERSLRRQGWDIYRFSNQEVKATYVEGFRPLVAHVPGAAQGYVDYGALTSIAKQYDPADPNYIPF
jgi:hypothetical protein